MTDEATGIKTVLGRLNRREGCVFCDPAKIKSEIEWLSYSGAADGRDVMVFEPLGPVVPGHVLVVPRIHSDDAASEPYLTGLVATVAAVILERYESANLITNVGRSATQSVFHLHWHVVPREPGDGLALPWSRPRHAIPTCAKCRHPRHEGRRCGWAGLGTVCTCGGERVTPV